MAKENFNSAGSDVGPVFIVGSSRSGTTMFRDLLRQNPAFLCPEETHFFRWNEPCQSTYYTEILKSNATLIEHRKMDGVSEEEFSAIIEASVDKGDLFNNYMRFLVESRHLSSDVLFVDKTPQHVYGLELIRSYFPGLRVIHLVRNPLNVCASLMLGRQFDEQPMAGAFNFWVEAVRLINEFTRHNAQNVIEIKYEDLITSTTEELKRLYGFLGADWSDCHDFSHLRQETNRYQGVLTPDQIDLILSKASSLGYEYRKL